jgi:hypothetical protein
LNELGRDVMISVNIPENVVFFTQALLRITSNKELNHQRLSPEYVVFLITVHLTCKWTREYIPVGQEKMIKMNVYATIAIDIDIT